MFNHAKWTARGRSPLARAGPVAGPEGLPALPEWVRHGGLPDDNLGSISAAVVELPAGSWALSIDADDGVRAWIDDKLVVDAWISRPSRHTYRFTLDSPRTVRLRINHFELTGVATLIADLHPARD